MIRATVVLALPWFVGTLLLLSELRWIRRPSLVDRLAPHGPAAGLPRRALLSVSSFRDVVGPLAHEIGERASRLFGVAEDLDVRLRRIHSPLDAPTVRVRQLAWSAAAFVVGTVAALTLGAAAPLALLLVVGAPILAFLAVEHRLARASDAWQRRIFLELPVVSEQLGMLLAAGWSLRAAVQRLAERGRGACAADLRRVVLRMRQGLTEVEALREWSSLADVDALDRLVRVLALDREAADLDRLIAQEARAIRRDAQRRLMETIERRTQQVWIPVTVAALVPGVVLMGVPFVDALSLFST